MHILVLNLHQKYASAYFDYVSVGNSEKRLQTVSCGFRRQVPSLLYLPQAFMLQRGTSWRHAKMRGQISKSETIAHNLTILGKRKPFFARILVAAHNFAGFPFHAFHVAASRKRLEFKAIPRSRINRFCDIHTQGITDEAIFKV